MWGHKHTMVWLCLSSSSQTKPLIKFCIPNNFPAICIQTACNLPVFPTIWMMKFHQNILPLSRDFSSGTNKLSVIKRGAFATLTNLEKLWVRCSYSLPAKIIYCTYLHWFIYLHWNLWFLPHVIPSLFHALIQRNGDLGPNVLCLDPSCS